MIPFIYKICYYHLHNLSNSKVVIVSVHHFSVPNDGPMATVPNPTGQVDGDHCRATFGSWIAKRTSFTHVLTHVAALEFTQDIFSERSIITNETFKKKHD